MKNKEVGVEGEKLAQGYLIKQGYEIIEINKRFSRFCEIDIIAKHKDVLIFVEVKTRSNRSGGYPEEAVGNTKIQNLQAAIAYYLQINKPKGIESIRVDVISIMFDKAKMPRIYHIKNITIDS